MQTTNNKGISLIKKYESFSATAYICPAGYSTIGYGHLITKNESFCDAITIEEAEEILRQDLQIAENSVRRNISSPLTDNQFAALVSFTFNLGGGALQSSTLRRKINSGLYDEVPTQFLRWVYAGGRKLKGLIRRRTEEAELFTTPDILPLDTVADNKTSNPKKPKTILHSGYMDKNVFGGNR